MTNDAIRDDLFREAVEAIDAGNLPVLQQLLLDHPQLVSHPLELPQEGYFRHPWLLWFIADNPIRHGKLPANIVEITRTIITFLQHVSPQHFQAQIDYTLGLVVTGKTPLKCGVQVALIDLLIDAGARVGNGHDAIANGNLAAAKRLIERGGALTLATAVCLGLAEDIARLLKESGSADRETALAAAAFYGKADMVKFIVASGVDVNAYPAASSGFHHHATALHQAVSSGSLETVQLLVTAGAGLMLQDKVYHGTPLDWAKHMQKEQNDETAARNYAAIEKYLAGEDKMRG